MASWDQPEVEKQRMYLKKQLKMFSVESLAKFEQLWELGYR